MQFDSTALLLIVSYRKKQAKGGQSTLSKKGLLSAKVEFFHPVSG